MTSKILRGQFTALLCAALLGAACTPALAQDARGSPPDLIVLAASSLTDALN